jgi:hypothetical protein
MPTSAWACAAVAWACAADKCAAQPNGKLAMGTRKHAFKERGERQSRRNRPNGRQPEAKHDNHRQAQTPPQR